MQLLLWLMFLRLNLFLNLCNHPLLPVNGLVSSSVPYFFWKSSCRLKAFCRNNLRSRGTLFLFISSNQKFKAFSTFITTSSRAIAVTFAVCGATEKLARFLSLFSITLWMEDSFLPYNLAISAYDFFFYHNQNFHFLTNGRDITAYLRLRSTTSITTHALGPLLR